MNTSPQLDFWGITLFVLHVLPNLIAAGIVSVELYMSPVETWCHNLNYYIPDEEGVTKDFTAENMTRIRKFDNINLFKPT